jgi:hypothetical protein
MPLDLSALKAELDTDPLALGYAALVTAGDDPAICEILNAATGEGVGAVAMTDRTKGEFLLAVAPAVLGLASLSDTLQRKWDRMLGLLTATDTVEVGHPGVSALLDVAVIDGVLTADQKAAILTRPGSRAEVLFGPGVTVTPFDAGSARNLGV